MEYISHRDLSMAPNGRYSRQTVLPQIGIQGQENLAASTVAIVGVGALGSSIAEMLARAGVGVLRLIDRDYLELHNLQRQSLYTEADVRSGIPKAAAAARRLAEINSEIDVEPLVADITPENALDLLRGATIILDGTDNLQTRYLVNDCAIKLSIPWIYSGVIGVSGVCMPIVSGETACLRCLFPEPLPAGSAETCDVAGVLGSVAHAISAISAAEAIKLIVNGHATPGLLTADLWQGSWDRLEVARNPDCPACSLHRFDYLDSLEWEQDAGRLCGRDAVQVRLPGRSKPDLSMLGSRLQASQIGEVVVNEYLVRLRTGAYEMTLFADGRVIVKGTDDAGVARSLVARYIGT
ncbi:MAG: ThiF family adenylyltransferase [Chloroflexota bacterium]|nr:ThiF family adenylyltransferase [Chloroflexota bacterium]